MRVVFVLLLLVLRTFVFAQISNNINLLYHWEDTTLTASAEHDNKYNEVWGFVQNGKEYGVIGTNDGTRIFDLSKFWNIHEVAFIPGETQGKQLIHRDYHDYKGYLYIVSDENDIINGDTSKLKIVDLSYLPDSVHVVYNSKTLFNRSHNIFIDTLNAKLYSCGGNSNPGIKVFSLANPELPVLLTTLNLSESSHDVYVRNDTAYINDGYSGMFIYDFSDNANPQLIGSLTSYLQQGYNHSGWLSADGKTYVLADETHNMDLKVLDISDLSNIMLLDTLDTELDSNFTIPHNVMIRGDYLFVSYYFDGMYVFNIEDPSNAFVSGYYHTSTRTHQNNKYQGNWGVYCLLPSGFVLASDMQTGFYVFDADHAMGINKIDNSRDELIYFPNPAADFITFSSLTGNNYNYFVNSIDGKHVASGKLQNNSVNFSESINNGTYFITVYNKTEKYSQKIIINKK